MIVSSSILEESFIFFRKRYYLSINNYKNIISEPTIVSFLCNCKAYQRCQPANSCQSPANPCSERWFSFSLPPVFGQLPPNTPSPFFMGWPARWKMARGSTLPSPFPPSTWAGVVRNGHPATSQGSDPPSVQQGPSHATILQQMFPRPAVFGWGSPQLVQWSS
jgi:hypothetical protein